MNRQSRILAGTALGLIMATAQLSAAPRDGAQAANFDGAKIDALTAPVILAQAPEETEEQRLLREAQEAAEDEADDAASADEEAPAEEPAAEETPAPAEEPAAAEEPVAEDAPAEEPAPEPEQDSAEPAPEPEPVPEPEPADEPGPAPAQEPPAEDAPVEEPAAEDEAATPEEAPAEAAPTAEETPVEDAPTPEPAPAEMDAEQTGSQASPEAAPLSADPETETSADTEATQDPADAVSSDEEPEAATPVQGEAPADAAPAVESAPDVAPQRAPGADGVPGPQTAPEEAAPVDAADPAAAPQEGTLEEVIPEDQAIEETQDLAPILDSQKDAPAEADLEAEAAAEGATPEEIEEERSLRARPAGPPPTSDQDAQALEQPVEIQTLRAEEGRRIDEQAVRERRRERREGAEIVREFDDRAIIRFNNITVVRGDDRPRLVRDAEVYYEELPRGRIRETIVRPNGVEIVTIRDRYGDIVQRSRFSPDGREYVLVYADDRRFDYDRPRRWRDPGRDLPPLHLTIPVSQYILEANRVQDPDIYYEFLHQPPVEQVREIYTVDEVKYSPRIRDIARRIDLDTLTFDFGSASISESEIVRLEGVADAMNRMLDENPAETFLIEGHTDAVGSDEANLALSDRRAEAVAIALTNVFDIPPENLVTQGYGEGYLKIETQEPERRNRRVAIRRITPLITPVAQLR